MKCQTRKHYKKVFNDKNKFWEMLELRSQGYSLPVLAGRYGVDHTTILWHCKKHGVEPGVPIERKKRELKVTIISPRTFNSQPLKENGINPGKMYKDYLAEEKRREELRKIKKGVIHK